MNGKQHRHAWRHLPRALLIGVVVLTGCATVKPIRNDDPNFPVMSERQIAYERALMESLVAMSLPGTKLCRQITLGIGVPEWVEAESLGVDYPSRRVSVKVTRLGQGTLLIAGREVKLGETIQDSPLDWTPCLSAPK